MALLDRDIAISIVLMPMAWLSRAMTMRDQCHVSIVCSSGPGFDSPATTFVMARLSGRPSNPPKDDPPNHPEEGHEGEARYVGHSARLYRCPGFTMIQSWNLSYQPDVYCLHADVRASGSRSITR
jgi:hypothetical protein